MRQFLTVTGSGEVRLAVTDLWDGVHERTEYRVIGADGLPLRAPTLDLDVDWAAADQLPSGGWYVNGPHGRRLIFQVEERPVHDRKVACPRASRRRARCAMCADDATPLR
jgi:hypothetical protein